MFRTRTVQPRHALMLAATVAILLGAPRASASETAQHSVTGAPEEMRVAVLLINFAHQPSEPWSKDAVRDLYFGSTNSVSSYYAEVSGGQLSVSGSVFGYLKLNAGTGSCRFRDWGQAARSKARSAGISLGEFTNIVYIFPYQRSCWWNGFAGDAPNGAEGRDSWINGLLTLYVAVHELGHNRGLGHAASLKCTSGETRVAFSGRCSVYEYGDPYDVMGYGGSRHVNAWHRWELGFLPDSEVVTVTSGGTYHLSPVQIAGDGPRMLRIPRPSGGFYFLEYRQSFGAYDDFNADAPPLNGVTVRVASAEPGRSTKLVDTTPGSCTANDAPLRPDRTFRDPINDISITTVEVGPAGAEVEIRFGGATGADTADQSQALGGEPDTSPPTSVSRIRGVQVTGRVSAVSWEPADDDVGVDHYEVMVDGVEVGTTCDLMLRSVPLKDGRTYQLGVRAVDAAGNVGPLETASYYVPDFSSPSLPRELSAVRRKASVSLRWSPGADNVGVTRYRLSRNGRVIANLGAGATTYVDKSASGTSTTYWLVAFDAAGNASRPVKKTVNR